jgi:hypothetical protein
MIEHYRHSPNLVKVAHVILTVRLGVGNVRDALSNLVKVF